jgi:hypothetical protein
MAEKQPKPWVKDHLVDRDVKWVDLKDKTKDALNAFSKDEIKKLDDLGAAFDDDNVAPNLRITAVH